MEQKRVAALQRYAILDTPPEDEFNDLVQAAADVCSMPIALIAFIHGSRYWYKARLGMDTLGSDRDFALCEYCVATPDIFIVPDARLDQRFSDYPCVVDTPHLRFYAGAPIFSSPDTTVGALCVIDRVPRSISAAQKNVLKSLSRQVTVQLEHRILRKTLAFGKSGALAPGVHDVTFNELRTLAGTNTHRAALWQQFMSFAGWPILSGKFRFMYVAGSFVTNDPHPDHIDVILQPIASYGPSSFETLSRFFLAGLSRFMEMYSVRLHFWLGDAPDWTGSLSTLPSADSSRLPLWTPGSSPGGIVRIDLLDADITSQIRAAADPVLSIE